MSGIQLSWVIFPFFLVVLVLLGVVRRPAWQAALAGLVVGLIIAITVWRMPTALAISSTFNGVAMIVER